jgi:alcohol dehydrogenase/propanol-preferring alcohol dehydrogenase
MLVAGSPIRQAECARTLLAATAVEERTMAKMRAAQVARPGGALELVEREIPTPGRNAVRVKVEACGVCHSDVAIAAGQVPGTEFPRVLGHEIAGVIDALGPGVSGFKVGDRVGVGWMGGIDGTCDHCRRGEFFACDSFVVTGAHFDGGYAEYMIAPQSALARRTGELPPADAAPLLCAGLTTYNALRNLGLRGGDLVAIHGVGGLGHLAIQFATKMGFRTVAVDRGAAKEPLARKLGATSYLDSTSVDPAKELARLGGARAILETISVSKPMAAMIGGLGANGILVVIGVSAEPLPVVPWPLINGRLQVRGWSAGTSMDSEDTLAFSALTGVRPMIEVFPLARAKEAFDRMLSGEARFRVVLDMSK